MYFKMKKVTFQLLVTFILSSRLETTAHLNRKLIIPDILKPIWDHKEYRGIVLENEMKVMLVSDPTSNTGAASLELAVGSTSDPYEYLGLAHLCQHLIGLGSKNYPNAVGLLDYRSKSWETQTKEVNYDTTKYSFTVDASSLNSTLDRLVDMVISPLFDESVINREVIAVDSEFRKKYVHTYNFPDLALKYSLMDPTHPLSMLSIGNFKTLRKYPNNTLSNLQQALLKFHGKYYSSNLMSLTVVSNLKLDELQNLIERKFQKISNKMTPLPSWSISPMGPNELGEILNFVDTYATFSIWFPIFIKERSYDADAEYYISLFQDNISGGLQDIINKISLTNESEIEVSYDKLSRNFAIFKVFLPNQNGMGMHNVTGVFFKYIEKLKEQGPQKGHWENYHDKQPAGIKSKRLMSSQDFASTLSSAITIRPMKSAVLEAYGAVEETYNADHLNDFLSFLAPLKIVSRIISHGSALTNATKVDPIFGKLYERKKFDSEIYDIWENVDIGNLTFFSKDLKENPEQATKVNVHETYVTVNPEPISKRSDSPRILKNSNLSTVWVEQDISASSTFVKVEIYSSEVNTNYTTAFLGLLFQKILETSLKNLTLSTSSKESNFKVNMTTSGLEIEIKSSCDLNGLKPIIANIFQKIESFNYTGEEIYDLDEYNSVNSHIWGLSEGSSFDRVVDTWEKLFQEKRLTTEGIENISPSIRDFENFVNNFFKKFRITWLFYGNIQSDKEVLSIVNECQSIILRREGTHRFPILADKVIRFDAKVLPAGSNLEHSIRRYYFKEGSIVSMLFQIGVEDYKNGALADILEHIGSIKAYDRFVTKDRLSDDVTVGVYRDGTTISLYVSIRTRMSLNFVEARIEHFLAELEDVLNNISEQDLANYNKQVTQQIVQKPDTVEIRFEAIWKEIISSKPDFKKTAMKLSELKKLTLSDLQNFYKEHISPNSNSRRRFAVRLEIYRKNKDSHSSFMEERKRGTENCPYDLKFPFDENE